MDNAPTAGNIWVLLVLMTAYIHHSLTGFCLPAMLPQIGPDLGLSDDQGATLTAGYTFLYAVVLVPMGVLADKIDRPRLLSGGLTVWSLLTWAASTAADFQELLLCRIGFAAAQATQNPVCFSLIPELFPAQRTAALALYNCSIYIGRSLSFGAVIALNELASAAAGEIDAADVAIRLVPLDGLDAATMSVLYTAGDLVAVAPVYNYSYSLQEYSAELGEALLKVPWRQVLEYVGLPGLALAIVVLFTVDEPREPHFTGPPLLSSRFLAASPTQVARSSEVAGAHASREKVCGPSDTPASPASRPAPGPDPGPSTSPAREGGPTSPASRPAPGPEPGPSTSTAGEGGLAEEWRRLRTLLGGRGFQAVTASATLNDIASWSLIAWQAPFLERVYGLESDVYAPIMAAIIPIGGILGGVGSGLLCDRIPRSYRGMLTAGATLAAAPFLAGSLLAPTYEESFEALLLGFALSESWRAPAALMVREVAPEGRQAAAAAVHLCIRNIVGGLGPLAVASLNTQYDLRHSMLLVPACMVLSGLGFWWTEAVLKEDRGTERKPVSP